MKEMAMVLTVIGLMRLTFWGWVGWLMFAITAIVLSWFWYTSRIQYVLTLTSNIADQARQIKRLSHELEHERQRVIDLKAQNDELRQKMTALHEEYLELRGQFSQMNVAYGKLGDQMDKLREDLRQERDKRDQQFAQWIKEKAQRGDL
jgi:chromosome segregation ATPase